MQTTTSLPLTTTPRRNGWKFIGQLLQNDMKLIGRDSFMSGMIGYILVMAVVVRLALPGLTANVLATRDFDLTPYFPLLVSYLALTMGAVLAGTIFGFILLEERDDNTLKAMLVSPLPMSQYLAYRVGVPMGLGFLLVVAVVLIINAALIPLWQLLLIAVGACFFAPATALFFAAFAENKVQGFAMLKVIGSVALLIIMAWFIPEPYQWLVGVFPPYWIAKAYWLAYAGDPLWFVPLVIGAVLLIGVNAFLARRFLRVVYQ